MSTRRLAAIGVIDVVGYSRMIDNHPGVTVDRYLRNVRWHRADDVDHYRRGLAKAGMPV